MLNGASPAVLREPQAESRAGSGAISERVLEIVAECTRYPPQCVTLDASFEDELGIDSVKRAEIAARLLETFDLKPDRLETLSRAHTLRALIAAIEPLGHSPAMRASAHRSASDPTPSLAPLSGNSGPAEAGKRNRAATRPEGDTLSRVTELAARVTRYPVELLAPDADVEDELGIDSVKLQEILAVAEQSFPELAGRRPPALRTLRELAAWIGAANEAPANSSPATATPTASRARAPTPGAACAVDRRFEGKIVLVSGSGHGLGRITAFELARQGASVVINSFHQRELGEATAEAIRKEGGRAHHVWASMARTDQVQRLFAEIEERHGGLDFFIHNASNGIFAKLADATEDDWLKSFRTNVLGLHRAALESRRLMRARGGGKILTLSSVFHDRVMDYFGVQGPIKACVESLTRFLAKELMAENIQVNCISLGALDGQVMGLYPEAERIIAAAEASSLGQRRMTELEAARIQLSLLGPEMDSVTGALFRADRGMLLC
jgi:enoyl-[acyl-carrier protein] reductase III